MTVDWNNETLDMMTEDYVIYKDFRIGAAVAECGRLEDLEFLLNNITEEMYLTSYFSWWDFDRMLKNIAKNPNCTRKILKQLAQDDDWGVRWTVAQNENCTRRTLKRLAQDDEFLVRSSVALNENCPKKTLTKLAKDEKKFVRECAQEQLDRRNGKCA